MTANQPLIVMRRASPNDADIVAALTDAAYATYISRLGRKPQPMTADYRHLATDHPVWLLYLGLIIMRWRFSQSGRRFALSAIGSFAFVLLTFWGTNVLSPLHNP